MKKILAFSLYGPLAASHRVRLKQYSIYAQQIGYSLSITSLLSNRYLTSMNNSTRASIRDVLCAYIRRIIILLTQAREAGLIVIYGELFPFLPGFLESLFIPSRFIYDLDDAFFLKYTRGNYRFLEPLMSTKFEKLICSARLVTAGNRYLESYCKRLNPNVLYLPSVVDTSHYIRLANRQSARSEVFTVGWIGSSSTSQYLDLLHEPLAVVGRRLKVRLLVVGGKCPEIPNIEVKQVAWNLQREVEYINSFDVGVMPLHETPWVLGKCSYKLIQCMSCGIPVVASALGSNTDVVDSNSGFLASTSQDWVDALLRLATDRELRARMGAAARNRVIDEYSLVSNIKRIERAREVYGVG